MTTTNGFKTGDKIKATHFEGLVTKSTKWEVHFTITGGNYGWADIVGESKIATLRTHGGYVIKGDNTLCGKISLIEEETVEKPIKLESIEVIWSESELLEDGQTFGTIQEFQAALDYARTTAPKGGAYDKTSYKIHFSGSTEINHTGRIDLHHISEDANEPQGIVEHIKAFADYVRRTPRHGDMILDVNLVESAVELQVAREEVERLQGLIDASSKGL